MAHAPVYVGNYEYDADERELEKTFEKYGRVKTIEYKSGFCFVHFDDETDASEAIRKLDGREWGRLGRRLRVEFAKNDANVRAREAARRKAADPNTTLFVAGFDRTIRETDLEKAFEGFGRLKRCELKKTYAFVEYENLEDAKDALESMHGSKIDGREITVEYVNKKPRERGDRDRDRGGDRGGRDRGGNGGRDRGRDRGFDDRRRGGGGGYEDRGRGGGYGRDRYDDRGGRDRGRNDDRRGGYERRDRSRSYERRDRDKRRRSPSYDKKDRTKSPPPRRGGSISPRRPSPAQERRRSRTPMGSPGRGGASPVRRGDSPSRSRSPMEK